jgi:outer membrane immunogenic protein
MRTLLTIAASLFATSAFAADLPVRSINKAPDQQFYGSPWDGGLYAGGAIGYGWIKGSGNGSACNEGCVVDSFETSPQGVVGGGHIGVGGRFGGNWYGGLEGAFGIGNVDGTAQNPGFIGNINSKTHTLFSVSGRLGYIIVPNIMLYGGAGWAWAGEEFSVTGTDGSKFTTKPVADGAMVRFGVEYALNRNWTIGLEGQHYFLKDINAATTAFLGTVPVTVSAKVNTEVTAAIFRLNYNF